MNFVVYGGYELPRLKKTIDSSTASKRGFWDGIEDDIEGLSQACGCYVFAAQNRPWYIGLAEKQTFEKECLTHHKLNHYNSVLDNYRRAVPCLYFIAKLTPNGDFASPSKNGHIDVATLEQMLIGLGLSRNPEIVNIRGTKLLREMNVPGIINTQAGQGKAYAVQEIRSLFGI